MGVSPVGDLHRPNPSDMASAVAAIESRQIFWAGMKPGTMSISAAKKRKRRVAAPEKTK
jgi:hypothetical protein